MTTVELVERLRTLDRPVYYNDIVTAVGADKAQAHVLVLRTIGVLTSHPHTQLGPFALNPERLLARVETLNVDVTPDADTTAPVIITIAAAGDATVVGSPSRPTPGEYGLVASIDDQAQGTRAVVDIPPDLCYSDVPTLLRYIADHVAHDGLSAHA